jgi:hypothetical protein
MTPEKLEALCREIVANWDRWEGEALQAGQAGQSSEACNEELLRNLRAVILKHLSTNQQLPEVFSAPDFGELKDGPLLNLPPEFGELKDGPPLVVSRRCRRCGGPIAHYRLKGCCCPRCG